jgi:hypothetical protein
MNDYERRYTAAMKELEATEMWRANYAPPLLLLQRKLGMQPRPPHYLGTWSIILVSGSIFAVVWGTAMAVFVWPEMDMEITLGTAVAGSLAGGVVFGAGLAFAYGRMRRKWKLSKWEDL